MNESLGYLQCRCGACRVTLCDPRIRFRIECLCYDCRQRVLISNLARGAEGLAPALAHYERGVDLYYFANALRLDDAARRQLEYSKLRRDAFNTTASARCCGTVMFGAHPAFEGRAVWATPDACTLVLATEMAPQFYLFAGDFPPEKLNSLRLANRIPVLGSASEAPQSAELSRLLSAVRAPLDPQHVGSPYTTFEQLYAGQTLRFNNACFGESRAVGTR